LNIEETVTQLMTLNLGSTRQIYSAILNFLNKRQASKGGATVADIADFIDQFRVNKSAKQVKGDIYKGVAETAAKAKANQPVKKEEQKKAEVK